MNILLLNFLIGACLGSHALVVVQRDEAKDFIFGFSRCDICAYPLSILDEIPILSYLLKRGRCNFCHSRIPLNCLNVEIIGGLLFFTNNFLSYSGFLNTIFMYFILLISLFDYQDQEFDINLLIIPLIIAMFSPISEYHNFSLYEWIIFAVFLNIFVLMNVFKKMGLGDTFVFILLYLFIGFTTINIFLYACIGFLIYCLLAQKNQPTAFIPFILLGLISHNFVV